MATDAALGKRRADAIARIEQRCQRWAGDPLRLPTASRHGSEVLLVLQLEALADYLDEAPLEQLPARKSKSKSSPKHQTDDAGANASRGSSEKTGV